MVKVARLIPKKEKNYESVDSKIPVLHKIFYVSEKILNKGEKNVGNDLNLDLIFHPGKGRNAMFLTHDEKEIMEVIEFFEPHRSWLLNSNISSSCSIYITTPIDGTFFTLRYIHKYCKEKAHALDSIHQEVGKGTRLLSMLGCLQNLRCVADVKIISGTSYCKYSAEKTIAWLVIKTKRLAEALKDAGVHCSHIASSRNYVHIDLEEKRVQEVNLRIACELVGSYIDMELYTELTRFFEIPIDDISNAKRKPPNTLILDNVKKLKLDHMDSLSGGVEESTNNLASNERTFSTKQKALAKSAKGTKNIASFFKK